MHKETDKKVQKIKAEKRRRTAKYIRELRAIRGMTQTRFADEIGSSKSYMSRLENEKRGAGDTILSEIELHFGQGLHDFFMKEGQIREAVVAGKIIILATEKEALENLRPGMILFLSKKDMKNKGLFITGWDFEGATDMIKYTKNMKIEIDPNASRRATAQITGGNIKL
jgi:transcriptional regulator with XRE-family HTH domain